MRAAAHARKLALQRQKVAEVDERRRQAAATMVLPHADRKASHKHKLWKALHANDWERHVGLLDDPELVLPMRVPSQFTKGTESGLRTRKLRRENRTSTVVSERVYLALQRGPSLVRSTLEVEDLMLFVAQVHPLKLLSPQVQRALCEQACLVRFGEGERVCNQGDVADAFYVILTGSIQVFHERELPKQTREEAEAVAEASRAGERHRERVKRRERRAEMRAARRAAKAKRAAKAARSGQGHGAVVVVSSSSSSAVGRGASGGRSSSGGGGSAV